MNVAIDGPAGAGKSTIAKLVAKKLGSVYVDTGAMYRAMALYLIRRGILPEDTKGIEDACGDADISLEYRDGVQRVILNGENVTPYLRSEEVGKMASVSSANGNVRSKLVALQQKLAKKIPVVMDGRDIGTVVLPDAEVKIFLTAGVDVRAKRRYKELLDKKETPDFAEIRRDIAERDYRDTHRENSPLKQAKDAVLLDSSGLTINEVADRILKMCAEAGAAV
ncbi:MAG TPA: (d)CMP kinase [Lachnospiraceae bacterium]|nr:(d)CMP kinase [Lachnospiraceae bacterium]